MSPSAPGKQKPYPLVYVVIVFLISLMMALIIMDTLGYTVVKKRAADPAAVEEVSAVPAGEITQYLLV